MKAVLVTVILDGIVKESRVYEIETIEQLRTYSFALLDFHSEYGDFASYRVEEYRR